MALAAMIPTFNNEYSQRTKPNWANGYSRSATV
ncbi:hypothetical protein FHS83_001111 [Rhizomicrobium palustre]|uniref:Uncharacterized protein n=1 Tax=Rhizomicrobium palustre TaxID=189966 RepID=A0A846MWS8_9PROT|nr:hypothetical protein [Rhizomicrobium palustre]